STTKQRTRRRAPVTRASSASTVPSSSTMPVNIYRGRPLWSYCHSERFAASVTIKNPQTIMIRSFRAITPRVGSTAYVDPAATVIGDVTIGERSSIWPSATLRGDIAAITIGEETSIQEGTVVHTDEGFPTHIGDRVTVGHSAVLHGCTVEDDSLI